jgi:hypothetical protein
MSTTKFGRRSFLSGLLLALLGQALPSLLGGRASRPFQRGRCPVFEPGENRRRIEGFRRACPEVCERLNRAYTRVAVKNDTIVASPAVLSLSDGTLLPGWTAEQQGWWRAGP